MTIGFGETEKRYEMDFERTIRQYVADRFYDADSAFQQIHGDKYQSTEFHDDFQRTVRKWLESLGRECRAKADEYQNAETFPDRYSYFWPYVLGDANYLVFIIKFNHINRRHTASPDGWALMMTERLFYIYARDLTQ